MSAAVRPITTPFNTAGVLTPEQTRAAIALAQGCTVTAAADSIGVHRSTLYNWFKEDPAFSKAVEEIRKERNERIQDQMREIGTLALSRVRRILEDGGAPAGVQLRAAMMVLDRPLTAAGFEIWNMPWMERIDATLGYRPSLLQVPEFDIFRHISTLSPEDPEGTLVDIAGRNSTPADIGGVNNGAGGPQATK